MKRRCFADPPHLLYYYPNLGKPHLKMTDCLLVMTALPDQDTARSLAHSLLEEKLAACINLMPAIVSFYEWKGETCEDSECLLLIKTRQSCYGRIEALIHTHHPYELPEIIAMEISHGLPAYLEWIHKSTQE